ncbi:MAG: PAS domain S-box protein [Deltaproteobacteria bacterium]|nr:PAS domain S-box protein [Deltaproteobacteria bacterium]
MTAFKREDTENRVQFPLDEQEDVFRILVKHTPGAIAMCDRKMYYVAYSDRWIKDFNLGDTDLMGKCHYDVFPELPDSWKEEHQRCLAGEVIRQQQEVFPRADGTTDWVKRELHPWRDAKGDIQGLIMFAEVITERVLAEKKLRESEARYRNVFEHTGTATVIIEEDTTISLANSGFENLSGYAKSEIEGKMKWTQFVVPEDLVTMKNYHEQRRRETDTAPNEYEFRFRDRCGSVKHIFNQVARIPGTKKSIASLLDITTLKEAQEALKASEEQYRLVVDNANDVIILAQDGEIKFANKRAEEVTGFSRHELLDHPFSDFIHPKDREALLARHRKRLAGEDLPLRHVVRGLTKNGGILWVEVSTIVIQWKGSPATLNFVRDITSQKKLEEQLQQAQKMEAVGTLAGGIAHDFNNLLMAIQGNVSLGLLDVGSRSPIHDNLKNIEEYVRKGADLTKQLLGFARRGKYEVKTLDLNEVVEKQNVLFGRTKKEITLHAKYQEHLWPVEADRVQIEQVLLNLYVNAWQAMPGEGTLYIETRNVILDDEYVIPYEAEPGRYVKISVTDTGTGMDQKTKERIFEPFFTTKEIGRGTGLGLASVYGIVQNHGGFITVYSEIGEGTSFHIYLPASQKAVMKEALVEQGATRGKETLLLVDDEEMILEVASDMLKALGYRVHTADGGKEALEVYENRADEIDLVILDLIMPDMGGGAVYDRLKAMNPSLKVLLSSGYSINGQAAEILNRGCNGFIQKPFNLGELSRKLRSILESGKAE